jgi:serine acetyltransferase
VILNIGRPAAMAMASVGGCEGARIGWGLLMRVPVTIGNRVFIGAGALVVKSIADHLTSSATQPIH